MSSEYSSLAYRIAFASLQGMGVDLARKLLDVVGSEEQFFFMKEKELRALTQGRSKIYSDNYRRERLQRAVQEEAFKFSRQQKFFDRLNCRDLFRRQVKFSRHGLYLRITVAQNSPLFDRD